MLKRLRLENIYKVDNIAEKKIKKKKTMGKVPIGGMVVTKTKNKIQKIEDIMAQ